MVEATFDIMQFISQTWTQNAGDIEFQKKNVTENSNKLQKNQALEGKIS